jgi:hypothetical protein
MRKARSIHRNAGAMMILLALASCASARSFDLSGIPGQTIWHETFQAFADNSSQPPESAWHVSVQRPDGHGSFTVHSDEQGKWALLSGHSVVASRKINLRDQAFKGGSPFLRLSVSVEFPASITDNQDFAIQIRTDTGRTIRVDLNGKGGGTLENTRFRWRSLSVWQTLAIDLNGAESMIDFALDGRSMASIRTALVPSATSITEIAFAADNDLKVRIRDISVSTLPATDIIIDDRILPGLSQSVATVYQPGPSQAIFYGQSYEWESISAQIHNQNAIRTPLNVTSPLKYWNARPGVLLAVLWIWDFGFLEHIPPDKQHDLNGWASEDSAGGEVRAAPDPFHKLQMFTRPIAAGEGEIQLNEYFGQWIIVGFRPSEAALTPKVPLPKVQISNALTRHNIVQPDTQVLLSSEAAILDFALYQKGHVVLKGKGAAFSVPSTPGRYALEIDGANGTRFEPLTVAYGGKELQGWDRPFFPIHFYNGYGYKGLFEPNEDLRFDLQTMDMFEMGANTYFLSNPDEVVDDLGARTILNLRSVMKPLVRGNIDPGAQANEFRKILSNLGQLPKATLGFYVEDEPSPALMQSVSLLEKVNKEIWSQIPLLYTLHGSAAPVFWRTVNSDVRMVRAYPIRKSARESTAAQIREELSDYLVQCQSDGPSPRLWLVVQAFGDEGRPNRWDAPTPGQLQLMVNLALSRGVKGITWFCYDSSPKGKENLTALVRWPFVPQDLRYGTVIDIDNRISRLAPLLATLQWNHELHQANEAFDIQILEDTSGRSYAWITNLAWQHEADGVISLPLLVAPVSVHLAEGRSMIIDLQSGKEIKQ